MWIIGVEGFVSVVVDADDRGLFVVRARVRSDLEFIERAVSRQWRSEVIETLDSDYRYRIRIDRQKFADVLIEQLGQIDYQTGVKDRCVEAARVRGESGDERSLALYGCWQALARMQPSPPWSLAGGEAG